MDWPGNEGAPLRPAAAAIILSAGPTPEVLLGRRNKGVAFMGGHHVFPGGRIEEEPGHERVRGVADIEEAKAIFATVREAFEETGLLLTLGEAPSEAARRKAREDLHAGKRGFASILEEFGQAIDGASFRTAGLWITPPFSPIRFHTRYYLHVHEGPRYESVSSEDGEIVALDWFPPAEARRQWHQGAIHISTPIAYVLRHLAAYPVEEALPWLRRTPDQEPGSPHGFEPRCGINILPLKTKTLPPATHTNCVIVGEDELYIIDPGAEDPAEQAQLDRHIERLELLGGRVTAIVLTHAHPDHVSGAAHLQERYRVPVWAHEACQEQLQMPLDRRLRDNEVIEIAGALPWRLRCLHTPGHDPGHLSFFEETTRTLLCGDMMANPGTILIAPAYGGDMTRYLDSLERLAGLDFSFTIPAHGLPLWSGGGRERLLELIAHRLEREQKIQAAYDSGARTVAEMIAHAYDDTPVEAWPLAEHQLLAHCIRLRIDLEST